MQARRITRPMLLMAAVLCCGSALADNAPPPQPTPELLEFLGDFGDRKGEWVDPNELEKMQLPERKEDEKKDE